MVRIGVCWLMFGTVSLASGETFATWKARIDELGMGSLLQAQREYLVSQVGEPDADPQRFTYNADPKKLDELTKAVAVATQAREWAELADRFERLFAYNNRDWVQAVGYTPDSKRGRQALAALAQFWEGVWTQQAALALQQRFVAEGDEERSQLTDAFHAALAGRVASQRRVAAYKRDEDAALAEAQARIRDGQFAASIEILDDLLAQEPANSDALAIRAAAQLELGTIAASLRDCESALRANPSHSGALAVRGQASAQQGKFSQARSSFDEALQHDPKHVAALAGRAWLLATCPDEAQRSGSQAVVDAIQVCELTNWSPDWYGTLAAAYAEAGQFEKAAQWQSQVVGYRLGEGKSVEVARHRLSSYLKEQPLRDHSVDIKQRLGVRSGSTKAENRAPVAGRKGSR